MTASRRSRSKRTRRGKRLELTQRDMEIFRALARYRYLRSTYLYAFAGGASETRFKERLGDLFHESYIERPEKQWEFANARSVPVVYEIGEGARRILREHSDGENDARTFLAATAHRQFVHSVLICECLASIELATLALPNLRFIPWCEILARLPENTKTAAVPFRLPLAAGALIPDGLFGLEYRFEGKRAFRFFALEVDRGTMPVARSNSAQTSYLAKLDAYRGIIAHRLYKTQWGIPNLLVLTVTTSDQRMNEIMRRTTDGASFLFKAVQPEALRFPLPTLLSEPWQRPDAIPLKINEE